MTHDDFQEALAIWKGVGAICGVALVVWFAICLGYRVRQRIDERRSQYRKPIGGVERPDPLSPTGWTDKPRRPGEHDWENVFCIGEGAHRPYAVCFKCGCRLGDANTYKPCPGHKPKDINP